MKTDQTRAMIAVLISGLILVGWQFFFAPKTTEQQQGKVVLDQTEKAQNTGQNPITTPIKAEKLSAPIEAKGEIFEIFKGDFSYKVSSNLEIVSAQYKNKNANELFKQPKILQEIFFISNNQARKISFNINKITDSSYSLTSEALDLKLNIQDSGVLKFEVAKNNGFTSMKHILYSNKLEKNGVQISQFTYLDNKHSLESITVGSEEQETSTTQWFGSDFYYHTLTTILNKDNNVSTINTTANNTMSVITPINQGFSIIFVKKIYDQLIKIGNNLHFAVDFGFFSIIAVPVLRGLQFFHSIIPNWGYAIILLTLLIRFLTFPLQYISTKNMKKMQSIQPELTKIKEKYKNDPARVQKETMALFKRAGTNPMSGCLPMILQMPIFFAFYKVLYNSVELVESPFIFWINDLSAKDPYYLLPVLMGIAMFAQQKLTPTTTADPTQQKVMMFLPLIFAFIMKDLPSGLNLYIFISTLFGIAIQYLVLKRIKV